MLGYVVMSLNGSVILAQSLYRTEKKKEEGGVAMYVGGLACGRIDV